MLHITRHDRPRDALQAVAALPAPHLVQHVPQHLPDAQPTSRKPASRLLWHTPCTRQQHLQGGCGKVEGHERHLQAMMAPDDVRGTPEAWAELVRCLGIERVAALLATPVVLRAELRAAEERLRQRAA